MFQLIQTLNLTLAYQSQFHNWESVTSALGQNWSKISGTLRLHDHEYALFGPEKNINKIHAISFSPKYSLTFLQKSICPFQFKEILFYHYKTCSCSSSSSWPLGCSPSWMLLFHFYSWGHFFAISPNWRQREDVAQLECQKYHPIVVHLFGPNYHWTMKILHVNFVFWSLDLGLVSYMYLVPCTES